MCECGAIAWEGLCVLESAIQYVCVCVLKLRAPGTSCPLPASPTVGRASSIGPEQCQKKAVIKTN